MVEFLRETASSRKLRLFARAFLERSLRSLGPHLEARNVTAIRRSIEDLQKRLDAPPEPVDESLPEWQQTYTPGYWDAYAALRQFSKLFYQRRMQQIPALREWDWQREGAALLRDICGNP